MGEGEDKQYLERLISDHNLTERARLVGRAGNISDWYNAADVFALTSSTEGFPNALIEAMAHGVPCVSYDCLTGPGEIIDDTINGLLVETSNKQALTSALERLFSSTDYRQEISLNSKDIISRLDPSAVMAVWEREMDRLTSIDH